MRLRWQWGAEKTVCESERDSRVQRVWLGGGKEKTRYSVFIRREKKLQRRKRRRNTITPTRRPQP